MNVNDGLGRIWKQLQHILSMLSFLANGHDSIIQKSVHFLSKEG